ncbi:MAG: hypothetical protein GYB53_18060 [Rhodobacteraceae bacterium]|nr:hypothetical protein [Paracoccaceae bacterium]MBR9823018.1 hypothetical protein [Paracoccaceae bacterium]
MTSEKDTADEATFEVVATARGARGGLVEPGARFAVTITEFSENWMKPATQTEKAKMLRAKKKADADAGVAPKAVDEKDEQITVLRAQIEGLEVKADDLEAKLADAEKRASEAEAKLADAEKAADADKGATKKTA